MKTLGDLRSDQAGALQAAEAERVKSAAQGAASASLVDGLRLEAEVQTAEVVRLRVQLAEQSQAREADARRFVSLQALIPQAEIARGAAAGGLRPSMPPPPKPRFET